MIPADTFLNLKLNYALSDVNECFSFLTASPLHVVTNRKQAEVGSLDDRGEVRGSQGALGLQEQQQTERKPPPASQRQERPQRSVCDVITQHWSRCEEARQHVCRLLTVGDR